MKWNSLECAPADGGSTRHSRSRAAPDPAFRAPRLCNGGLFLPQDGRAAAATDRRRPAVTAEPRSSRTRPCVAGRALYMWAIVKSGSRPRRTRGPIPPVPMADSTGLGSVGRCRRVLADCDDATLAYRVWQAARTRRARPGGPVDVGLDGGRRQKASCRPSRHDARWNQRQVGLERRGGRLPAVAPGPGRVGNRARRAPLPAGSATPLLGPSPTIAQPRVEVRSFARATTARRPDGEVRAPSARTGDQTLIMRNGAPQFRRPWSSPADGCRSTPVADAFGRPAARARPAARCANALRATRCRGAERCAIQLHSRSPCSSSNAVEDRSRGSPRPAACLLSSSAMAASTPWGPKWAWTRSGCSDSSTCRSRLAYRARFQAMRLRRSSGWRRIQPAARRAAPTNDGEPRAVHDGSCTAWTL